MIDLDRAPQLIAAAAAGAIITLIVGRWVDPARVIPFVIVTAIYLTGLWWAVKRLGVQRERNRALRDCVSVARQAQLPQPPPPGAYTKSLDGRALS